MADIIIGAGQTGRGLIARLLKESGKDIIFIDKNKQLIEKLNRRKEYTVNFFSDEAPPKIIRGFAALHADSTEAADAAANAENIFISVSGQNLPDLIPLLENAFVKRKATEPLSVIVCENAVDCTKIFTANFTKREALFAGGIIFCTTVFKKDSLDIISENINEIPYDSSIIKKGLSRPGFIGESKFNELSQRKIYTYNCINACISYLGQAKNYEYLSQAANDKEISQKIYALKSELDKGLAKYYSLKTEEQAKFSQRAVDKFSKKEIIDPIERNIRDVQRKLGPEERIIAPLVILRNLGIRSKILEETAAAAIAYAIKTKSCILNGKTLQTPEDILEKICKIEDKDLARSISPAC